MARVRARVLVGCTLVGALLLLDGCAASPSSSPATGPASVGTSPATPLAPTSPPTASISPAPTGSSRLHVVGIGDSVMAGTNCDCPGIVDEYATGLAARLGRPVHGSNRAEGGLVTSDVLDDLRHDASLRTSVATADVVLVTIGANDLVPELQQWQDDTCGGTCYEQPARRMGANLARILGVVHVLREGRPGAVLVTNYWNVFTDGEVARGTGGQAQVDWSARVTTAANEQICAAALVQGDVCVDLVAPFKKDGTADPTHLLADDGDHPDAAGVGVIVQALLDDTPAL